MRSKFLDGTSLAIFFAVLGCLGWLALSVFLLLNSQACEPSAATVIGRHLTCLPPNNIGDFLAGVLAPLAIIILALAAFLQSRELRAQQTELKETRDVFIQQSDLMRQQIIEAKRSGDLLERQNAILVAQEETRLKEYGKAELLDMLARLSRILRTDFYGRRILVDNTINPAEQVDMIQSLAGGLPEDDLTAVAAAVKSAVEVHITRNATSPGVCERLTVVDRYGQKKSVEQALVLTQDAVARARELGADSEQLAAELNLHAFAWVLKYYLTPPVLRPTPDEIPVARSSPRPREVFAPGLGLSP